jgi:hypothetical protein
MGTVGWAQAEADRARIRSVLRAPPDWRAPATTSAPASTAKHGAAGAPIARTDIVRTGGHALNPAPPQAGGQAETIAKHGVSQMPVYPKSPANFQAKLTVSSPGDIYEQEADRIAGAVAAPAHPTLSGSALRTQRLAGQPSGQMDAAPASVDQALASPGRPLELALRQDMEQRFGHDFSRVRVHTGTAAEQSARDVNAHAYTVGHDMVFGAGEFAPGTNEGRRLLAHELTHVVQQLGADGMNGGQSNDKRSLFPIAPVMHLPDSVAPTGVAAAVLGLQSSAGNRAVAGPLAGVVSSSSLRLARAPRDPEIQAAEKAQSELKEVIEDFLEELGRGTRTGAGHGRGAGRRTVGELIDLLRRVAGGGGPEAQRAAQLADALQASRDGIADLHRARGTSGVKKAEYAGAKADETAAKAEHAASKSEEAVTKAEKSAAKTTVRAEGTAAKALVKAEETAIKAEAKLGSRVAAGAGRLGLSLLLPGPEDAIILMAQFAGSYEEAWDIIEQRNTRSGIAMGIAAGMMGLDWEWVHQNLWRRFATRDVATEVIGAVGKAERSYNDGLVRGHKYGAGHPRRTKNRILAEAFTILAQEGYETDEEGLFTIDTVARVAGVLMPIADDFLRQAAERKQAREKREEEQRRKIVEERQGGWRGKRF